CFVDSVLPQPVTTLGAVIVCRLSSLMTVVRSSHTMIAPGDVARIVAALVPPPSADESTTTASMAAVAVETGSRRSDLDDFVVTEANEEPAGAPTAKMSIEIDPRPSSTYVSDGAGRPRKPPREPRPRRVRRVVRIVSLCVVGMVAAAGTVVLFSNWLNHRS